MAKARLVITVDGLAGSGKTTLARLLAEKLGWVHLNSGLLYRGVAWLVKESGTSPEDERAVLKAMGTRTLSLTHAPKTGTHLHIDGVDHTEDVRSPAISDITSRISTHAKVREKLIQVQRDVFPGLNIVAEGRDMGTVIFPESPLKFFIEAKEEVRIERRLKQLHVDASSNDERSKSLIKQMEIEIRERDKRDSGRAVAPTKAAVGATIIDNSSRPLTVVLEEMYDEARKLTGV